MIVTYGQPSNYSTYTTVSVDSWESCVLYCYNLSSCVVAHSPVDPINCEIFNVMEIWAVQKLNSSQKLLVAFKVDNTEQTCPAGDNAPTFDSGTATGTATNSIGTFNYNITFTGSEWDLGYQNSLTCESGWTTFSRPLTDWCINLFGGPNVSYTQAKAAALCTASDAVLSGLETQEERNYAARAAWDLMGANYPNWTAFWISGARKTACTANNWPSIAECNSDIEQFTYSDTYMTNYAGYTWDGSNPDRNASGTWQNCVQLWIRGIDATVSKPTGTADDQVCTATVYDTYALRGVVCGKLPDVTRT